MASPGLDPAGPATAASVAQSFPASDPELPLMTSTQPLAASAAPSSAKKPRSCAVCRSRKVRCDKLSPCTNCRRANIPCVVPQVDRIPRWARRLDRAALPGATVTPQLQQQQQQPPRQAVPIPSPQVLERLRNLESLVRELNGQLQQAHAATGSTGYSSVHGGTNFTSPAESSIHVQQLDTAHETADGRVANQVQGQLGRLAIRDGHSSRYVSSNFWSRIKDEIDELSMDVGEQVMDDSGDSDSGSGEAGQNMASMATSERSGSTRELDRDPADRHAFMFRHNVCTGQPELDAFRPLPSQVPFLINVYHENVNMFMQAAHLPTVHAMARGRRTNGPNSLSDSDEALLFSIYYAAVISMEDDEVLVNFGTTKNELALRFRRGFEHALAKADFLTAPNLTLVQALVIFLFLVRRHDSPRYVWMMVGVTIRMAKSLGLHRDGAALAGLTPYEVEMRRRVWWALYMLDLRSSEDQGTEITIPQGSFDTKRPLSINDEDISPQTKETPREREGFTDMTIPSIYLEAGNMCIKFLSIEVRDGIPDIEHYGRLCVASYAVLDSYPLQLGGIRLRMGKIIASLVVSKITLQLYLPFIATSLDTTRVQEVTTKLLTAAIEVAEFDYELNEEQAFRQWRWMFQTFTHWYAVVYMLIQITRRPWSPISERAWVALHSPWLIPKYPQHVSKNNQVIVPLRRLMASSREHRKKELYRLQSDPLAMRVIEDNERRIPRPRSNGINVPGSDVQAYYFDRWRHMIAIAEAPRGQNPSSPQPRTVSGDHPSGETTVEAVGGARLPRTKAPYGSISGALSHPTNPASCHLHPDVLNEATTNVNQQQTLGWSAAPGGQAGVAIARDGHVSFDRVASTGLWEDGTDSPGGFQSWLWAERQLGPTAMGTFPSGQFYDGTGMADAGQNGMAMEVMEGDVNWLDLIESAKMMEWEPGPRSMSS